jgi:hypothetical protein
VLLAATGVGSLRPINRQLASHVSNDSPERRNIASDRFATLHLNEE